MSEKMLVTQALDERDLLVKKIADKIAKAIRTVLFLWERALYLERASIFRDLILCSWRLPFQEKMLWSSMSGDLTGIMMVKKMSSSMIMWTVIFQSSIKCIQQG